MKSLLLRLFFLVLVYLLATSPALTAAPAPLDDSYLSGLVGRWTLDGTILKKSAHQTVVGSWVLHHQFLLLQLQGSYEANVYIGYDAKRHEYIAHWLDVFGGAGATAVGHGARRGESVAFLFAYTDGLFRTTITYDRAHNEWHLRYVARGRDGTWGLFGDEHLHH